MDDESFNIYSLKIIIEASLTKMGREPTILNAFIDVATNGEEAVRMFKALSESESDMYCLVITDISMPIKDGY